jgi:hypothetical protein
MRTLIQRRRLVATLVWGFAGFVATERALAAPKTYKYRCPKCKLIQEFGSPGVKKCPNDGKAMVRQN